MKTFLGFLSGTLLGFLGGLFVSGMVLVCNKDLREYIDKQAVDV